MRNYRKNDKIDGDIGYPNGLYLMFPLYGQNFDINPNKGHTPLKTKRL